MTTFTVKFFARLKEETGTSELNIQLESASTVGQLKDHLLTVYPQWQQYLEKNLLMAVNQTMAAPDTALHSGDEVAFFPPVTGG